MRTSNPWSKYASETSKARRCRSCNEYTTSKPLELCSEPKHKEYYLNSCKSVRAVEMRKIRNAARRMEVLLHYGGKCACCGFSDLNATIHGDSFLNIDHINGANYRFTRIGPRGMRYPQWFIAHGFPTGFRVLCKGCNVSMPYGEEKCFLHRTTT